MFVEDRLPFARDVGLGKHARRAGCAFAQACIQFGIKKRAHVFAEGEVLRGEIHVHQAISLMARKGAMLAGR